MILQYYSEEYSISELGVKGRVKNCLSVILVW